MEKVAVFLVAVVAGLISGLPSDPAEEVKGDNTSLRVRGIRDNKDADMVFGGLFPIRSVMAGTIQCGDIRPERSVERMEAMLYALDSINNSTDLLPGLKIGFDIRDTCSSETVGTEEALDIIISGGVLRNIGIESDCPDMPSANNTRHTIPTGVVGAASSGVSRSVASLLRLFNMPQISYSSTSTTLSDIERYNYFFRTISADNLQTSAMVEFLLHMNWTFVTTINSEDTYGSTGIDSFLKNAEQICIEEKFTFPDNAPNEKYTDIAKQLVHNTTSNVVVLFTLNIFAQRLIREVHNILNDTSFSRRFLWIASDAWARSSDIQNKYAPTVAGYIGFLPYTEVATGFHEYFSKLTAKTNVRNKAIFEEYYDVYCKGQCSNGSVTSHPEYTQGTFIPLVIDAVYAFAHAAQLYLDTHCSGDTSWDRLEQKCAGSNDSLTPSLVREYLLNNVSFRSSSGFIVEFDDTGSVEIPYRLVNFQARLNRTNISYHLENIGVWYPRKQEDDRKLQVNSGSIQFGLEVGADDVPRREPIQSTCSEECSEGQFRLLQSNKCCWKCTGCTGRNYSSSPKNTECSVCPEGQWGNKPHVGSDDCIQIPERSLKPSDPIAIVALVLSGVALIVVALIGGIFIINCKHSVIKSSGREQVTLLLIGITLSFCLSFIIVPPPSIPVCLLQRIFIWTSFALIYGALLVKIIRVYRLFNRAPTASRPRFTKPHHQILFTLVIVAVQLVITLASLITAHPIREEMIEQENEASLSTPTKVIACKEVSYVFFVAQLIYDAVLILLCTFFGWKTRNFPENFNESKYILFTSLALILIWLGFIPTFIVSPLEYRYIALNFPIILSSAAILVIFFIPKIYFIYAHKGSADIAGGNGNFLTDHIDLSKYTKTRKSLNTSELSKEDHTSGLGTIKVEHTADVQHKGDTESSSHEHTVTFSEDVTKK